MNFCSFVFSFDFGLHFLTHTTTLIITDFQFALKFQTVRYINKMARKSAVRKIQPKNKTKKQRHSVKSQIYSHAQHLINESLDYIIKNDLKAGISYWSRTEVYLCI